MSTWNYYQTIAEEYAALSNSQPAYVFHQKDAENYVDIGVKLLKENYEAVVEQVFTWAEGAAEAVLETRNFTELYPRWLRSEENWRRHMKNPPVEPDIVRPVSDKELAIEENYGRMQTLRSLGFARWFLTGEPPLQIWRQMTDCRSFYYEADHKKWGASSLTPLLHDFVAAEQYEDALLFYRRDTPDWIVQWREEREARRQDAEDPERRFEELREERIASRLLASAASHGLGRNRFPRTLRRGFEKQMVRCTLGTQMDSTAHGQALIRGGFMPSYIFYDKPWQERLGWHYLSGRFFTGQTNAREIVRSWRN